MAKTKMEVYFRKGSSLEVAPGLIIRAIKGESPLLLQIEADAGVRYRHVPSPRPAKRKEARS